MKKTLQLGLLFIVALALSLTLASAEGKCGNSQKGMLNNDSRCGDSQRDMKRGDGRCGTDTEKRKETKPVPSKGKCGQGKCGKGKCGE